MGILDFLKKQKKEEQASQDFNLDIPPPPPDASLMDPAQSASQQPSQPSQPGQASSADAGFGGMDSFPEPPPSAPPSDIDVHLPSLDEKGASFPSPEQPEPAQQQPLPSEPSGAPEAQEPAAPQPSQPALPEQEPSEQKEEVPEPSFMQEPEKETQPAESQFQAQPEAGEEETQTAEPEEPQPTEEEAIYDQLGNVPETKFVSMETVKETHDNIDDLKSYLKLSEQDLSKVSSIQTEFNAECDRLRNAAEYTLKKLTSINRQLAKR